METTSWKLGIVMPACDAAATIRPTLERIPVGQLEDAGIDFRVYVVDDGSTDDTVPRAEAARPGLGDRLEILRHEANRGYGAAQKTGLGASLRAGAAGHVILHSDGQYAPEEINDVVAPIRSGHADVAIGSKFAKGSVLAQGMPFMRVVGIRFFDWLENRIFGLRNLEFHSGYMAYSTHALRSIDYADLTDRYHFDGEMVLCAAKTGLAIHKAPISTRYHTGTSLKVLPYILEIAGVLRKYAAKGYAFQAKARHGS